MTCKRCGQCCVGASFTIDKSVTDLTELAKWMQLHFCGIDEVRDGEAIRIRIPLTCSQLSFNYDTGEAFCHIYEDRPKLCRDYMCKRARDGDQEN